MSKQPLSVGKSVTAVGAAALVAALGFGGFGWQQATPPESVSLDVNSAELQPAATYDVQVHDPDDVLTVDDENVMHRDAERLDVPAVVSTVHYMVFGTNRDNALDTVEEYSRENLPEIFTEDGKEFVPGTLIIGVGLDPRQSFITGSDDVTAALGIESRTPHRQRALDAVKPGVMANNIPAGLFAGAQSVFDLESLNADMEEEASDNRLVSTITAGGVAGGLTALAGGILVARANRRRRNAKKARESYDEVVRSYADVAQRLDAINIRAHSLTSALADNRLREQWDEVQSKFVATNKSVDRLGNLSPSSPDSDFADAKKDIDKAAEITKDIETAEANIDTLYAMEHGDKLVRQDQLMALRHDVEDARIQVPSGSLTEQLRDLRDRIVDLEGLVESPQFIDEYVRLIDDYSHTLATVREQEFSDVKTKKEPEIPSLTSSDYRPGYGRNNFVPFWVMSSWHSNAVAEQQASSSSSSSGGYSGFSSGFSASGGTSSF